MSQVQTLVNLRANHYKDKIPALATLMQLAESVDCTKANYHNFIKLVIKSFSDDFVSYSCLKSVVVVFHEKTNVIDAACEAHKRVFGCDKQSSLIDSLENQKISGRALQMFWHQMANILTQQIKDPINTSGALTRHLLEVREGWYTE